MDKYFLFERLLSYEKPPPRKYTRQKKPQPDVPAKVEDKEPPGSPPEPADAASPSLAAVQGQSLLKRHSPSKAGQNDLRILPDLPNKRKKRNPLLTADPEGLDQNGARPPNVQPKSSQSPSIGLAADAGPGSHAHFEEPREDVDGDGGGSPEMALKA